MRNRLTCSGSEAALLLKPRPQGVNVAPGSEVDMAAYEQTFVVRAVGEESSHNALEEAFQNVLAHPEEIRGVQFEPRASERPTFGYGDD